MNNQDQPLFREEQKFRQKWLWALTVLTPVILIALFGYGVWQQIILGKPWGNNPLSDGAMIVTAVLAVLSAFIPLVFFAVAKLIIEVRSDGLYIRFFPVHLKFHRISLDDVSRIEACTYSPLATYGGWGIRWTSGGKAYNVSGNRGVRINYTNGKHLLIGSQQSDALAAAIKRIMRP